MAPKGAARYAENHGVNRGERDAELSDVRIRGRHSSRARGGGWPADLAAVESTKSSAGGAGARGPRRRHDRSGRDGGLQEPESAHHLMRTSAGSRAFARRSVLNG